MPGKTSDKNVSLSENKIEFEPDITNRTLSHASLASQERHKIATMRDVCLVTGETLEVDLSTSLSPVAISTQIKAQ